MRGKPDFLPFHTMTGFQRYIASVLRQPEKDGLHVCSGTSFNNQWQNGEMSRVNGIGSLGVRIMQFLRADW